MSIIYINPYRFTQVDAADADAIRYLTAVETADGQALELSVRLAVDAFIVGCKADGIWPAIKASCILAGARTLAGALVPLAGTAPTNFNFVAGDYNRKTGLVGDGSTKYLNSNYAIPTSNQNNAHAACRASSIAGPAKFLLADNNGSSTTTNISVNFNTSQIFSRLNVINQTTTSEAPLAGLYGVTRNTSTTYTLRSNNSNKTITQASEVPTEANISLYTRTVVPAFYSDARFSFYSIGESLDLALLDARVTALINAFGTAIP